MTDIIDMKSIEKNIFKTSNEDGLFDIYIGILFIGFGFLGVFVETLSLPLGMILTYTIVLGIGFPTFYFGKKRISIPRTGVVKLSIRTSRSKRNLMIYLAMNLALTIFLFILSNLGFFNISLNPYFVMLIIGILFFVLPFGFIAYIMKTPRFYATGLIMGSALLLAELIRDMVITPFHFAIGFGICGGIILVMGIIILIRFIKKYPLPKEERVIGQEER